MFKKLKPNTEVITAPANTEINPETGVLNMDEMFGQSSAEQGNTNPTPVVGADLPAWKCHKIVNAAKIMSVDVLDAELGEYALRLDSGVEGDIPSAVVTQGWCEKHEPETGGYLVVYEDGYQSYSPAEPFESGYTLLERAVLAEERSKCGWDERPDDPAAIEPKAPLAEAESLLAWLKTQPSTPENKAMRAQAGIVVDYLRAK